MSAYLAAHLPHLTSLHTQLALGPDALASDQARIEAAIKTAVEELLRERETQVDEYKEVIAAQKRRMSNLARALGDKGRNVVDVHRRESLENETLPKQLDRLIKQSEDLENVYEERIKHIESQQTILTHLAALLGPPIEAPAPLARLPAARSSLKAALPLSRVVSGSGPAGAGAASAGRQSNAVVQESAEEQERNALYDVAEHIAIELDGKEARVNQLEDLFHTLTALHTELVLPPIPMSQPHHFPLHLLPIRAMEETPGANAAHEKLLARIVPEIAAKQAQQAGLAEEGGEVEEEERRVEGLKGVEPVMGLLGWLEGVKELWEQEQTSREARIQALYDQIEPLWGRLQVDEDQMALFLEMNSGCSEAAIRAYEVELERCLELRRSSLSSFILGARAEIEQLWSDLMLSEDETGAFGAFIDDRYTEELLAEHEAYAEELRAEITSKAALLPRVREWHALVIEEEELERLQNDPDRFKRRGGAMLKEEKSRKRVTVLKPKIEDEMLNMIPAWEEANGRPFFVQGERVVDKIHEALEAKEAAKEAKKRARQGLGPPPSTSIQSRALQPAKTVRGTPAPSARSAQSTNKRAAPTPTPSSFGTTAGIKRTRIGPPSSTVNSVSASARSTSASAIPGLSGTGYRAGQAKGQYGQGQGVRAASATALQGYAAGTGTGTSRMGMGLGGGMDLSTPCPQPRPAAASLTYPGLRQNAPPPPPPAYTAIGPQSRIASNTSAKSSIPAIPSARAGQPATTAPAYTYTYPSATTMATTTTAAPTANTASATAPVLPPISNLTSLAKANGRRPKRESFKPRQSLMRGMSMIRAEAPPFGCLDEDGEDGQEMEADGEFGFGGMSGAEAGVGDGSWDTHEVGHGVGTGSREMDVGLGQVREEIDVFE